MGEPQDPYAGQPFQPYPPPGQPYPPPGYPGYQQAPGLPPGGYPGYPPPPGTYPGYPYGAAPLYIYARPGRPGMAIASAVLAFISSGMLLIAGILLFATAATLDAVDSNNDFYDFGNATGELTVDAILDLLAAAVLIVAGVQLLGRKQLGWVLTMIGNGLVVVYAIYWVVRTHENAAANSWAIVFAALAVVSGALAVPASIRNWIKPPA